MLCEICGEKEATFHYSEVINGNKTEHHLCNECAAKTDISYYSSLFDNDGRLGQLLSGLLGTQFFGGGDDPKAHVTCPGCGLSYGEFVKNSSFGCAECYNVFGPLLDESIKKIQGSTTHQGKKPIHLMKMMNGGMNAADTDAADVNGENGGISLENGGEQAQQGEKDKETRMSAAQLKHEADVLKKRLKDAIAEEDFEEAAKLRDHIKELTRQIERANGNV